MNVLLFGATGSVGGCVLRVCEASPKVHEVRAIVRRPLANSHSKARVFIHTDYERFDAVRQAFATIDACFYCLGISVTQVSGDAEYRHITRDFAVAAARVLQQESPNARFHFVSGQGANLRSRFMWARVKAETERELIDLTGAVCWRPAAIDGMPSASEPLMYRLIRPGLKLLSPFRRFYVKGNDIGLAMIQATREGARSRIIENAEIRDIADRAKAET
jgi:hypothetical protein